MDDHDEIGRPNYTRAGIERAHQRQQRGQWRFRLPWNQNGGAFRIRAAVALLISAYAWLWPLGWADAPRWTTLAAAMIAIRSGRYSADLQASDLSLRIGLLARYGGGVFLLWAVPAAYLEMQRSGVVAVLTYLTANPT